MITQQMLDTILPPGTLWGDLTVEIPPYDPQQFCLDWMNSIQSWENWEESILDPVVENWMPGLVEIQELEDEYEHMPGLTSVAWSEYIPVEEFPTAAEPLEVASEEDLIVPIPLVETVVDISTASHREENP
jgi:hypothetical protein